MSAAFKNSKKKLTQPELRKLMNEHKLKSHPMTVVKRIESPLARYNESGQLTCVLCKTIVKSEAVWTVHVNAKQHKQNVEMAKRLKEKTSNFTTSKRPMTPPPEIPRKKLKGILKNTKAEEETNESSDKQEVVESKNDGEGQCDSCDKEEKSEDGKSKAEGKEDDVSLPEGFFDDPKLDAKARKIEYKDPIEEEWEKFQREIREANDESAAIIAEDQEEATTERQIDEIDEQMRNWTRVLNMEKKKAQMMSVNGKEEVKMECDDSESEVGDDFDEYLDWRSKKAFS